MTEKTIPIVNTGLERPDLSLVIPCYNEEGVIRHTVCELADCFGRHQIDVELVVVDNGSRDGTGHVIDDLIREELPVTKVVVHTNCGYGNGVLTGFKACRGRYVGITASWAQVEALDVLRVYNLAARSRPNTLVKVRRRFRLDGILRKVTSILYNFSMPLIFGRLGSIDINGCPKIIRREHLNSMALHSRDWFLDAEIMIKAKRLGLDVLEINVFAQQRAGGSSHVNAATCWEFVVNIIKVRLFKTL